MTTARGPSTAPPEQLLRTERWFVRHGTPTMIEQYRFAEDVLPRMLPVLTLVAAAGPAWLVPARTAGPWRWVLLAVVVVAALAVWGLLSAYLRRHPRFSRAATIAILVVYAAMPVVVPLLQLTVDGTVTAPGGSLLGFVVFFAAAFVATLLATTYGVGALLRRGIGHTVHDLSNSVRLLGRALPAMLFVTLFLFFTAELWQAMNRLGWGRVALVVVLFAVVTVLASAARLRDEIGRVEQDLGTARLAAACEGTPLADVPFGDLAPDGHLEPVPLTGPQERNLLLVLATRQLVQAMVVGLALFTFFVVLGLVVVLPDTAAQWIDTDPAGVELLAGVPVAMLRNAVLFAAFGSMYFAVASMSDADNRRQFFAPILEEIERTLAVRAVYLATRSGAGGQ